MALERNGRSCSEEKDTVSQKKGAWSWRQGRGRGDEGAGPGEKGGCREESRGVSGRKGRGRAADGADVGKMCSQGGRSAGDGALWSGLESRGADLRVCLYCTCDRLLSLRCTRSSGSWPPVRSLFSRPTCLTSTITPTTFPPVVDLGL